MERKWKQTMCEHDAGRRLDAALARYEGLGLTRSRIQSLISSGQVTVDGNRVKPSLKLAGGEAVEVIIPAPERWDVKPEDIPVEIVHEDDHIIVVNKPRGMVVHPGAGNKSNTLVNALLNHCSDLAGVGGIVRPGLVHRLDKDTSGLLVVAKNDSSMVSLQSQLKARTVDKIYVAIVAGVLVPREGTIDAPIARHPRLRKKMAIASDGRRAVTHYETVGTCSVYSVVRLKLETGRTHQIRVHLSHMHAPIVGDPVYGGRQATKVFSDGQALHAERLGFDHPCNGDRVEFVAAVPEDMRVMWGQLCPRGEDLLDK